MKYEICVDGIGVGGAVEFPQSAKGSSVIVTFLFTCKNITPAG